MATTTPRLGLTKPLTSEAYDIAIPNANMDLIDAGPANFTICTSSTRPSTPDEGDGIYETDSNNILIRQSATWKSFNAKWFICTSSTRPASGLTFGGFPIYETDTGNRQIRNAANSAWIPISPYSVADAAAQTALGSVTEGFITYLRDVNRFYRYTDAATWVPLMEQSATQSDSQITAGTTTNTSYASSLGGGGVVPGIAFTANAAGILIVSNNLQLQTSGDFGYASFQIRTGSTIGSGTIIFTAADEAALITDGLFRGGCDHRVTGLTPFASYNIQVLAKASSTRTTTVSRMHLLIKPML
jgi:hypothetical protein